MVIYVRNALFRTIVLLLCSGPLWGAAGEQGSYGPVSSSDTLAEIAIKLKGDGPWHYQRWMYAIYMKNPRAFFGDNMNNLRLGATLAVPTEYELKQIDLAEAFRAVSVQLYVLQQNRKEKQESDGDLLLRARLQRLFTSNEMMQKESGELFDRIAQLEQQMGSVVDQVLESEGGGGKVSIPTPERNGVVESPSTVAGSTPEEGSERENSSSWWFLLLGAVLIYVVGFIWHRRVEAA